MAIIEDWSDDETEIATVTIVPPEKVDENTDEEDFDDDVITMGECEDIVECAGTFELDTIEKSTGDYIHQNDHIEEDNVTGIEISSDTTPSTSENPSKRQRIETNETPVKKYKPLSAFSKPKWVQRKNRDGTFEYDISPTTEPLDDVKKNLAETFQSKTPLELFSLFFDNEVLDMIIEETSRYAQQKNEHFRIDQVALKRFLGILILSGYHTLPTTRDYWSTNPTLGVPIVKVCMSRNRFQDIKRFIHFGNNYNLDSTDKMAKVRPLYKVMNAKFMQFGVWEEKLSIDEQMVPYFGRHSCKMFIRGKPIRFGYKLWCLCSASGYLYNCIPYAGAADKYDKQVGLGADVVLRLLENVEYPSRHMIWVEKFRVIEVGSQPAFDYNEGIVV
ncbi:piggyBac transposable element-derived protein 3-like [Rhagoletis pomonella]|uniref:piggyBac transposable element-derived protein 3-like n=1 Tax=Rhagoletis pomonella TaxID=28610 RepID=UPI001786634A|nr:piggyBac transposable element-derived protein 3-like [Rhagoletis pomonella]